MDIEDCLKHDMSIDDFIGSMTHEEAVNFVKEIDILRLALHSGRQEFKARVAKCNGEKWVKDSFGEDALNEVEVINV